MKKFFLALVALLVFTGTAFAQEYLPINLAGEEDGNSFFVTEFLKKLPGLKQGVVYSLVDSKFNYVSTAELVTYKGFSLEAGYAVDNEIVVAATYELVRLKDHISIPILDLIECRLGGYVGYHKLAVVETAGNNEWDAGITATFINVKF